MEQENIIFEDWYEDYYDGDLPISEKYDLLEEYKNWCAENNYEPVC